MAQAVRLSISEDTPRLAPGAHHTLTLTVANVGRVPRQCRLVVIGLSPAWYHLANTTFSLPIGGMSTTDLVVHPPPSAASPPALYRFQVQVAGADDSEILGSTVAAMAVGFVGDLGVEVHLVEAQGARGTFETRAINALRWAALLSLILLPVLATVVVGNRLNAGGSGAPPLFTNTATSTPLPAATRQQGHAAPVQPDRPTATSTAREIATTMATTPRPTPMRVPTYTPMPRPTPTGTSRPAVTVPPRPTPPISTTITITLR